MPVSGKPTELPLANRLRTVELSTAQFAAQQRLTGFPYTGGGLVDGVPVGSFLPKRNVTINLADTVIAHNLGRIPEGYLVYRHTGSGLVYDGANGGSDWTASQIVLRATVAGSYWFLLF